MKKIVLYSLAMLTFVFVACNIEGEKSDMLQQELTQCASEDAICFDEVVAPEGTARVAAAACFELFQDCEGDHCEGFEEACFQVANTDPSYDVKEAVQYCADEAKDFLDNIRFERDPNRKKRLLARLLRSFVQCVRSHDVISDEQRQQLLACIPGLWTCLQTPIPAAVDAGVLPPKNGFRRRLTQCGYEYLECAGLYTEDEEDDGGTPLDGGMGEDGGADDDGGTPLDGGMHEDGGADDDGGVYPDGGVGEDGGTDGDGGTAFDGGVGEDGGVPADGGRGEDAGMVGKVTPYLQSNPQ